MLDFSQKIGELALEFSHKPCYLSAWPEQSQNIAQPIGVVLYWLLPLSWSVRISWVDNHHSPHEHDHFWACPPMGNVLPMLITFALTSSGSQIDVMGVYLHPMPTKLTGFCACLFK